MSSQGNRCEEAKQYLAAYAIGATDPNEAALVEAALADCPELAAEMSEYLALSDAMLHIVPQTHEPPAFDAMPPLPKVDRPAQPTKPKITHLHTSSPAIPMKTAEMPVARSKVTASTTRAWWAAVAAAVALVIATNIYWLNEVSSLRSDQRDLEQRLAIQEQQQTITAVTTNEQHHRELLATLEDHTQAHATVLWNAGNESGSLHVTGLPELSSDRIYQLWLVREGQAVSMGLFEVDETGRGILLFEAPEPIENFDAIGVSIEPAPGSLDPTTPHVVIGEI